MSSHPTKRTKLSPRLRQNAKGWSEKGIARLCGSSNGSRRPWLSVCSYVPIYARHFCYAAMALCILTVLYFAKFKYMARFLREEATSGTGRGDEWISKSVKARLHYRGEGADLSVEYRCKRYGTKHNTVTHLLTYMARARQTMPARPTPERGQSATHWKPSLSALVGYENASRFGKLLLRVFQF
jgi:hypothetical protein